MGTPLEIVKELYAKLTAGDVGGALALMAQDIEWITMMDYKVDGPSPQKVLEFILDSLKGFGVRLHCACERMIGRNNDEQR